MGLERCLHGCYRTMEETEWKQMCRAECRVFAIPVSQGLYLLLTSGSKEIASKEFSWGKKEKHFKMAVTNGLVFGARQLYVPNALTLQ